MAAGKATRALAYMMSLGLVLAAPCSAFAAVVPAPRPGLKRRIKPKPKWVRPVARPVAKPGVAPGVRRSPVPARKPPKPVLAAPPPAQPTAPAAPPPLAPTPPPVVAPRVPAMRRDLGVTGGEVASDAEQRPHGRWAFVGAGVLLAGGLGMGFYAQGEAKRATTIGSAKDAGKVTQSAKAWATSANLAYGLAGVALVYGLLLEFLPPAAAEKASLNFQF